MVDGWALRRKVIDLKMPRLVSYYARASFDHSRFAPAIPALRLSQSPLLLPIVQNRAMRTTI